MGTRRTGLGFGDELEAFDPGEWGIAARPPVAPAMRAVANEAAAAAGFARRGSSEPAPVPTAADMPPRRGRRTGRNAQFNVKARPDVIAAFCAVADGQGWGLGETLEHAVMLLQERYPPEG